MKRIWMILLVLGLLAGGIYWKTHPRKGKEVLTPVKVRTGDLKISIKATGTVQPENRLVVRLPIPGRVESILVEEGQAVKKGQILAWMSSNERAAMLDAASAKGPKELAKWKSFYKATPLFSPIAGSVIARSVEPGQSLGTADIVLVLSDRLIVKTDVDETDIGKIKLEQDCSLSLDAYPQVPVRAKVDHIAYEAHTVSNVTTYQVEVLPRWIPPFMRSGMTASVEFLVDSRDQVLLLPAEAVQGRGKRASVQVADPRDPSKTLARPVEAGLSDGRDVEIVSGLKEGDTVLKTPVDLSSGAAGATNPFWGGRPKTGGTGGSGGGTRGGGGGGGRR